MYEQSIQAGDWYEFDKGVVLYVSSGRIYNVPDIVGKDIGEAKEELKNILYDLEYEYSDSQETGIVIGMSKEAGAQVKEDERVVVTVSMGLLTEDE